MNTSLALREYLLPADVLQYCEEHGIANQLQLAMHLAETHFHPVQEVKVSIEEDPEVVDCDFLVIDVYVSMGARRLRAVNVRLRALGLSARQPPTATGSAFCTTAANPRDFQTLAARLATVGAPAELRSAVGRSYYALFNVGVEWLRDLGIRMGRGSAVHGELQRCLAASGNASVVDVGSELNDLQTHRLRADYRLDLSGDVEKAAFVQQRVADTAEFIRTLDAAFSGPERPNIRAAILRWRRDNGYPT